MLIGIDGGGTKTALALSEMTGRKKCSFTGEGTNPADIGLEKCEERLKTQLDALLADFGGRGASIKSVYAGLAGSAHSETKQGVRSILARLLPNAEIIGNGSDAFNALYGENTSEGIALIAGTGSSSFALSGGETHQVGGWGYLVDDAGSGFRIGADALKAAYRAFDGRGESTMLKEMCEKGLEMPLSKAIPRIYASGKRYIASFARTAFEAYKAGDEIAADIIHSAVSALAVHVRVCLKYVSVRPATCVMSGGLIENDEFCELIKQELADILDEVKLVRPSVSPVYGALAKAAMDAGISVDDNFKSNYINSGGA